MNSRSVKLSLPFFLSFFTALALTAYGDDGDSGSNSSTTPTSDVQVISATGTPTEAAVTQDIAATSGDSGMTVSNSEVAS
jgi:hypothetical protein